MGKYSKNKKSNEQKFYERVIKQVGGLIAHTVGSTALIAGTILFGIKCATSGGYWIYLLSVIISAMVTIALIGGVIADACGILLLIKELHDGKRKY